MQSEHVQTAIETSAAVSSKSAMVTMGAGGVSAGAKWLGLDPITAIGLVVGVGGLLVSLAGLIINWYYKRLDEKRKTELHALEVKKLSGECNVK